jgi:hypothetical protein
MEMIVMVLTLWSFKGEMMGIEHVFRGNVFLSEGLWQEIGRLLQMGKHGVSNCYAIHNREDRCFYVTRRLDPFPKKEWPRIRTRKMHMPSL